MTTVEEPGAVNLDFEKKEWSEEAAKGIGDELIVVEVVVQARWLGGRMRAETSGTALWQSAVAIGIGRTRHWELRSSRVEYDMI